jgi:hypothetical protein
MRNNKDDKKNIKISRIGLGLGPVIFSILVFIPIEGLAFEEKKLSWR